jgi:two-component system nitrate/nitrite sensor histidine kinase NarX
MPHVSAQQRAAGTSAPPGVQTASPSRAEASGRDTAGAPAAPGPAAAPEATPEAANEAAIAEAVALERRRLARELHDRPVQSLWFLGTEIRRLRALAADSPSALDPELRRLQATWAHVYDELRQAMGELHRPLPADRTLVQCLRQELNALACQTGLETCLTTDLDAAPHALDPAAEVQLVRICQSALANVRRHAAARHVSVRLVAKPSIVVLNVEDDGAGFDATRLDAHADAHLGLAIMRERAESLGGTLDVTSAPGQGTRLEVRVPARAVGSSREAQPCGARGALTLPVADKV